MEGRTILRGKIDIANSKQQQNGFNQECTDFITGLKHISIRHYLICINPH